METILRKRWPYILGILAIIIILIGRYCNKNAPEPIIFSDPVKAPIGIAFIDANRFLNTQITNAKITLVDPDGMVVTSNGIPFNTIDVSAGVMSLALKQEAEYSVERPYRFTLKVEAQGYNSNSRNILVTSDEGQYVPIFMVKLEDPPLGVATASGSAALSAGGVLNTGATIIPTVANGISIDNIKIEMEPGTQPIYCNGTDPTTPFPRNLNYRISYSSPKSEAAGRAFPGGPLVTDAVDMNGEVAATPSAPIYFNSAGWMNLEMDADGDQVIGFTKPVTVTMPIPDSLVNPLTNSLFKRNDKISIWSLSERGAWREESLATVEGTPGNLFAKLPVLHLSTWNLDNKVNPCASDATITYTNNNTSALNGYTELLPMAGGIPARSGYLNYASGGGNHMVRNFPDDQTYVFRVYQNGPGSPVGTTSEDFSCSDLAANMTLSSGTQSVDLGFQVKASAGAASTSPICQNAVWFRQCTAACSAANCATDVTNSYNYGGILTPSGPADNQIGETTLHNTTAFLGNQYCIRLWYGGLDAAKNPIEQTVDFLFTFSNPVPPTSITGRKTTGAVTTNVTIAPRLSASGTYIFEIISTGATGITPINTCPAI